MAIGAPRRANSSSPLDMLRRLITEATGPEFNDGTGRRAQNSNPVMDGFWQAQKKGLPRENYYRPQPREQRILPSKSTDNFNNPRRELPLPGGGLASSGGNIFERLAARARDIQGRAEHERRTQKSAGSMGKVGSAFGDIRNRMYAAADAGGQNQGSLLDQYFEQLNQMQAPGMDLDPAQMAQDQFSPQFEMLANLRGEAETRGNANANSVEQLYQALANQVRGEGVAKTQGQYADSGAELQSIHDIATGSVQGAAQESNADMADVMRRLGIGEAAPDALEHVEQERSRAINSLAGNFQANSSANTQFGQNMVDFQQNTANTSDMAGANAKADTLSQLGQILSGYDNKKLDLTGQQSAAENQYAMQIAGMQNDAFSAQQDNIWRQMEAATEQQRWEAEFGHTQEQDRAAAEISAREYAASQAEAAANAVSGGANSERSYTNDPIGHATSIAAQLFPTDGPNGHSYNSTRAQASISGVQDAIQSMNQRQAQMTLSNLYDELDRRFPNNPYRSQYREIAAAMWKASGGF